MDPRKIFVLDTSVILHDHHALHSFEEHDVAIPLTVLEELDTFKKGSSVLNRNARQFIRRLDALSGGNLLQEWLPLNGDENGKVRVLPPPEGQRARAAGSAGRFPGSRWRALASGRGRCVCDTRRRRTRGSEGWNSAN